MASHEVNLWVFGKTSNFSRYQVQLEEYNTPLNV